MVGSCSAACSCWYPPALDDGLNHDEAYTFQALVSRSAETTLMHYPVPNNHIFHSLLAKASTKLLGDGEFALRLPTLVASVFVGG